MKSKTTNQFLLGILETLSDKVVEIYLGDYKTVLLLNESESYLKSVVVGKLDYAIGDCLVVKSTKNDNEFSIYINASQIKTIIPYAEPGFMKDAFLDEYKIK